MTDPSAAQQPLDTTRQFLRGESQSNPAVMTQNYSQPLPDSNNQKQPTQPQGASPPDHGGHAYYAGVASPQPNQAHQPEPTPVPNQAGDTPEYQNQPAYEYEAQPGPFDYLPQPIKEEIILEWQAPSRVYYPRNRQVYTTVAAMVFLVCLILFFLSQFLLIAVAIALAFLFYVLNTVPPTTIKLKLTNYGIWVEDTLYYWEEMGRFWFTSKGEQTVLHVEVARFPFRLTILTQDIPEQDLTDLLSQVLINQQPKPSFFDQAADWLERTIPLEKQPAQPKSAPPAPSQEAAPPPSPAQPHQLVNNQSA